MEIQEQQVLITGANRGIGRAIAQMCAESKAHLHLVNRTSSPELVKELREAGAKSVREYQADLSTREGVENFLEAHGQIPVDILINNAGQMTGGLLEQQSIEQIHSMLMVNINALIQLTHAFLPGMIERKKGKIINQASVIGYMHLPGTSTYAATKAAVIGFTEALQAELTGTGVSTLLLITPGVETRMFAEIPKRFSQHFDLKFLKSMSPKKYAHMIREAIVEDLAVVRPQGFTGLGVRFAQHAPAAFNAISARVFKRGSRTTQP